MTLEAERTERVFRAREPAHGSDELAGRGGQPPRAGPQPVRRLVGFRAESGGEEDAILDLAIGDLEVTFSNRPGEDRKLSGSMPS
jgi:hypothetical protein